MTPGFRYHVTTIVGIFLALAVGIMIGSSFVQTPIVEQQTKRLEELGAQFNREIAPLRESNRSYAGFIEAITPRLIANELAGIRVAIVQTGDYPETTRSVREALESAGAQVESETVLLPDFPAKAPAQISELRERLKDHEKLPKNAGDVLALLAESLGRAEHHSDVETLARVGLVETSGDYSRPVSFVVIVGGATLQAGGRAEEIDLPLIAALKPVVRTVVAAEPAEAEVSYIEALRSSGIPTVDNADTDMGKIAIVLALRAPVGDYGVKQTARSGILPALPER